MPTVERSRGYRFYFYSHEPNEPPHVHKDAHGCTTILWLHPVALARNIGLSAKELIADVRQRQSAFDEAWHGHFGA